ncbi:Similar to eukaryotic Peptidyl prolyl 4-hydroxylase, alpha subunit [hydrothermal vent metagenome]|uniref:Similar to eukaryotic Peptidyl prolyl 4-hydroxylase, alpha subunit n=1 Tax=hydrothermal vent metagenome TaxID=652676 RepID=A0A3B0RMJ2_9ZZZZ
MAPHFSKKEALKYTSPKRMTELGAKVTETLNANPRVQWLESPFVQIYACQKFISDADCDLLIKMIDDNPRPSTLYKGTEREGYRTSYSCNVDDSDPDIRRIDRSICDLMGMAGTHSEILQGQRYEPGQQFKDHHDFFHETEDYWKMEALNGGQRTWTAMAYLNEPEEGGATAFPQLQYEVAPRRGMLLMWNNMGLDGKPNLHSLHAGKPVVKGIKYIITKWFRLNAWREEWID